MAMTRILLALILTMMFFVFANCGPVDELSCANHVHRECKCNFDEIAKDGNRKWEKHLCNKLQECGECLAVPRCSSKYLDRFIDLTLTTIKMAKITNTCPNIKYNNLLKRVKGLSKCRGHNVLVYDHCGQRCVCDNGEFKRCTRIRKEFTQMPFDERRRFVDAYYKATTDPYYKDAFQILLDKHSRIPSDFLHHMTEIFLPWHRWYSLEIENYLRQIDCRVTLPYYQWSARVDDGTVWRTSDPTDVWSGGPQGVGGNGVKPSLCVQDGKFREKNWHLPRNKGGGCLKRNFNYNCKLYNQKKVDALLKGSFKHFEKNVREQLHALFHDCIGGLMPNNRYAANAPEFIFHHAFMDKLWHTFQNRGSKYKYAYYPSVGFRMPFANMYDFEFLDNNHLPGNVAVNYEDMKPRQDSNEEEREYDHDETIPDPDFSEQDVNDPEVEVE